MRGKTQRSTSLVKALLLWLTALVGSADALLAADLIVDGRTELITTDTQIDGSIFVQNGGQLVLRGSPGNPTTLTLVLDYDEEHHIDISDTSRMEVDNGVITSTGGYQYWIELSNGSPTLEVQGDDSWITFHSGIRPFDSAQVIVTGGDVEELQVRDNVTVTLSDAATYPVYFFDGMSASLSRLYTDTDYTISNTVSVPGGWSFQITDSWVEGYQIDLKYGANVTLDDSDGVVLSIHTPGDLGDDLQIVEGLTADVRAAGETTNLGSSFTFTDSNVALINVYIFGTDRVLLRDMHVNEVNAEQSSELIVGQKGYTTVLNCNLCQVYDDATFVVVGATIDSSDNVPSATSSYADFAAVGRGMMRFVDMDLWDLYLTAREEGLLEIYNCTHDPAKLNQVDPAAIVDVSDFAADFTADVLHGDAPLDVRFINLSAGNVTSHAWSFGDGAVSSQVAPTHQYAQAGVYTVSLTASGPGNADAKVRVGFIKVGVLFADGFESGDVSAWSSSVGGE